MTIKLHLFKHCIETEAKNKFKSLMDQCFNSEEIDDKLKDQVEIIRQFIKESDFKKLRASDKRLTGEIESDVIIKRNESGRVILEIPNNK